MEKKTIYANNVEISMQLYDIVMDFSIMNPDKSLEGGAKVFMSPEHAKVFAKILLDHIKSYEEAFGKIPEAPTEGKIRELQEKGVFIGAKIE
ncbi:DUF3467 domain-containing protein [Halalkalibacter krulwichiae]|uniref:DUF3467 domain-containing protein n=1 Tax=Halalkalibacter krulwichiae TaxID=199441 RepID=A0A1X9MH70_9BACI|nr:DUF3467 domain-containing protein [Halalkalibacter krulwichiae]ARK31850.1 hypothetical protein BkAM31D_19535 [Halalkalibacter krulwichiae]